MSDNKVVSFDRIAISVRKIEEVCKFCGATRIVILYDGHKPDEQSGFYHYAFCQIPPSEISNWCEQRDLMEYTIHV